MAHGMHWVGLNAHWVVLSDSDPRSHRHLVSPTFRRSSVSPSSIRLTFCGALTVLRAAALALAATPAGATSTKPVLQTSRSRSPIKG